MDHAGGVGVGEGLAGLEDVVDGDLHRERPLVAEERAQVLPFEVLHHQVGRAAVERTGVAHAGDVLALHLRGGLAFAEEALDHVGADQGVREEELDRHPLAEVNVLGRDDDAHPPTPSTRSTVYLPARVSPMLTGADIFVLRVASYLARHNAGPRSAHGLARRR